MQLAFSSRLSDEVREFVRCVEAEVGLQVDVTEDDTLNLQGPLGLGKLEIEIESTQVLLRVPSDGYFPNGAVRHELLHLRRLHVDRVPRLSLGEHVDWDPSLARSLARVDNALEHLSIVPEELRLHPERRDHWEAMMSRLWNVDIPRVPTLLDKKIWANLNWTFLQCVLPDSSTVSLARNWLHEQQLLEEADLFSARLLDILEDKVEVLVLFFSWFPALPRDNVSLEYLNCIMGSKFECLPVCSIIK